MYCIIIYYSFRTSKFLLSKNSPFLRTPTADYRSAKKDKSLAKTVYPTPKSVNLDAISSSKHKQRCGFDSPSRSKTKQSAKKFDSSQNQLLSILETPQIKRRSAVKNRVDIDKDSVQSFGFTPTSILKVKQMMRRSTSPSSLASSPSVTKPKSLESTPAHHKLRFSVPEKDSSYTIQEEDSVENARLASTKDTIMLKTLKTTAIEMVMEKYETEPIEASHTTNLIDFDRTAFDYIPEPMGNCLSLYF